MLARTHDIILAIISSFNASIFRRFLICNYFSWLLDSYETPQVHKIRKQKKKRVLYWLGVQLSIDRV